MILVVLALQLSGGAGLWPVWARSWSGAAVWPLSIGSGRPLTVADLGQIDFRTVNPVDRLKQNQTLSRGTRGREPGVLSEIFGLIRETESHQNRAALDEWARHFEESIARRMAVVRLAWDERFHDLATRLGAEQDRQLEEYAADVRREQYSTVSALEMQIAMCEDPKQKPLLEMQLAELLAQIEAKIAQRREGLSRQCALELENLRNQAREALTQLEARLREESRRALTEFAAEQERDYAAWLAQSKRAEESAKQSWTK